MQAVARKDPRILTNLSFVMSSRQREKVLAAVVPSPKTPAQIAQETELRLPHVSRSLSQLQKSGLVRWVAGEHRGKLYHGTDLGRAVLRELGDARGDRLVIPMARGSHFRNYHHWVSANHGASLADDVLSSIGINPDTVDVDGWYPLKTAMQVLEAVEIRFGDGTYDVVRRMLRDEAQNFSSIRRLMTRILPLPLLLELAPGAYHREFNHGRLEVDIEGRRALMKNYDWMSSRARCMAWLGTYEGALLAVGTPATVRKVACMLEKDQYCGYAIEW